LAPSSSSTIDVAAVYARYGPMVLRRCRRLLNDDTEAADAMHDVFAALVKRRADTHSDGLSSLLFTMATHTCLDRLRRQRRRPHVDNDVLQELAALDDATERSLVRNVLDVLFAREPGSTRVMAVLHHVDGLTYEQVGAMTGLSGSGVRKRLERLQLKARQSEHGGVL
jgi:RNA polymerase sigma-70 factor (ECF subfamily)